MYIAQTIFLLSIPALMLLAVYFARARLAPSALNSWWWHINLLALFVPAVVAAALAPDPGTQLLPGTNQHMPREMSGYIGLLLVSALAVTVVNIGVVLWVRRAHNRSTART